MPLPACYSGRVGGCGSGRVPSAETPMAPLWAVGAIAGRPESPPLPRQHGRSSQRCCVGAGVPGNQQAVLCCRAQGLLRVPASLLQLRLDFVPFPISCSSPQQRPAAAAAPAPGTAFGPCSQGPASRLHELMLLRSPLLAGETEAGDFVWPQSSRPPCPAPASKGGTVSPWPKPPQLP